MDFNIASWKYTDETQFILKKVNEEITKAEQEHLNLGGAMRSPYLEREYCYSIGYINGLKEILNIVNRSTQSDRDNTRNKS